MVDKTKKNNNSVSKTSNVISTTQPILAKPFLDVSKIEVFTALNFWRWQKRVSTLLDMYEVGFALMTSKPNSSTVVKQVDDSCK